MKRNTAAWVATLIMAGASLSFASDAPHESGAVDDKRTLVEMPAETQQILRSMMRDHLLVLSELLGHVADNSLATAAEVAEQRLGKSSMGKHRGTHRGMGPGRFMPKEMKKIGHGMHEAASHFATVAESGDVSESYAALQGIVAACVACHSSYRIR